MKIALFLPALLMSGLVFTATPIDGWYSGIVGGMSYVPDDINTARFGIKLTDVDYSPGYHIGGRLGYQANPLRYEIDGIYIRANIKHININKIQHTAIASRVETTAAMANVYYDINTPLAGIKPFLGTGLGYAYVDTRLSNQNLLGFKRHRGSNSVFAYQGIAGLTYNFAENYAVDIAYHYVATDKVKELNHIFQAHLASVGVVYRFNEFNYK